MRLSDTRRLPDGSYDLTGRPMDVVLEAFYARNPHDLAAIRDTWNTRLERLYVEPYDGCGLRSNSMPYCKDPLYVDKTWISDEPVPSGTFQQKYCIDARDPLEIRLADLEARIEALEAEVAAQRKRLDDSEGGK